METGTTSWSRHPPPLGRAVQARLAHLRAAVLRCGGQTRVLAFITEHPAIRKILDHLGLPSTGPPIARARRPAEFDFAG